MAQNAYSAPQRPYPTPVAPRQNPRQNPPVSYNPSASHLAQKQRPKSRSFSFRSDKSSSSHKVSYHETPEEKEAKRLHSKADPTLAMNEAEPCKLLFLPSQPQTYFRTAGTEQLGTRPLSVGAWMRGYLSILCTPLPMAAVRRLAVHPCRVASC